jgi:hypothetical protein
METHFTIQQVLDWLKEKKDIWNFDENAKFEIDHDIRNSKFEIVASKEVSLETLHSLIKKQLKREGKTVDVEISYKNGIFTCTPN